jgi:hypothetical protein
LSQPLTAVLSNAYAARYLLERAPLDVDELRASLDDVIKNDKRAGAVIDRLRALLKKARPPCRRGWTSTTWFVTSSIWRAASSPPTA